MTNLDNYTSAMLFDDKAYYIPKVLVAIYGFNIGYFIQELHWRLRGVRRGKGGTLDVNGRPWFFRSLNDYEREFSKIKGMSRSTIQRTINFLVAEGILLKWEEANPKYWGGSRTWYSLNYQKLTALYFEYLKANPDPVVKGDLEPDLGDEINEAGGMFNLNIPQGEGYVQLEHTSMGKLNNHTENTTENTISRVDRAAGAAQPAAPLEQEKTQTQAQSYLSLAPTQPSDRANEFKSGKASDEDGNANLPYDDLSMLGKFLVALSNKGADLPENRRTKTLTAKQAAELATPVTVVLDNGQQITISPDELYETDPLFKTWLERAVHPILRDRQKHAKPIARDTLVAVVRMKRDDFNLKRFYAWRERAQYRDWNASKESAPLPMIDDGKPHTVEVAALTPEELAELFGDELTEKGDNNDEGHEQN